MVTRCDWFACVCKLAQDMALVWCVVSVYFGACRAVGPNCLEYVMECGYVIETRYVMDVTNMFEGTCLERRDEST